MLSPGTTLSQRYVIQEILGQGGMGAVYLAEAEALGGKKVAVKEMIPWGLPPHELHQAVAQFKREASFLANLDHPNLVHVTDFFVEDGKHYLVMAYIKGQTLQEKMMERGRPFHWDELALWVERLLDVLEYLHGQSILFRDLKPSNIMIGDDGRLHLIDFGIARSASQGQKTTTFLQGTGTRGFSPIEQYGDRLSTDQRSDIYALGATIYYLLSGSVPPDAVERVSQRKKVIPLAHGLAEVPPSLDGILERAMALSPDDRFQSMAELRTALLALNSLKSCLPSEEIRVIPPGTHVDRSEPARTGRSRWRGLLSATGCFLLTGAFLFSFSAELSAADLSKSGKMSDSIALAFQDVPSGQLKRASVVVEKRADVKPLFRRKASAQITPEAEKISAKTLQENVEPGGKPTFAWESYPKAKRARREDTKKKALAAASPVAPEAPVVETAARSVVPTKTVTGPSQPVEQAPIYVMPPVELDGSTEWESAPTASTSSVYETNTQWASRGQSVDPTKSVPSGGPSFTNVATVASSQVLGSNEPASIQTQQSTKAGQGNTIVANPSQKDGQKSKQSQAANPEPKSPSSFVAQNGSTKAGKQKDKSNSPPPQGGKSQKTPPPPQGGKNQKTSPPPQGGKSQKAPPPPQGGKSQQAPPPGQGGGPGR
jgi:serine/threonine protein kinase